MFIKYKTWITFNSINKEYLNAVATVYFVLMNQDTEVNNDFQNTLPGKFLFNKSNCYFVR